MSRTFKITRLVVPAVAVVFLGAAGASAQKSTMTNMPQNDKSEASSKSKIPMPDQDFVKEAASGGMTEVRLGELAQARGSSEAVKSFGKRMVDDHTKAGDELKSAAGRANLKVPDKANAKDEATYNRLSKLSGAEFDREYSKEMVSDHTHDVSEFRKEVSSGRDKDVKSFASQTLPTLQAHLKQARDMQSSVSGAASNSKASSSY